MALGTFIAGAYTATGNYQAAGATTLGITQKGFTIKVKHHTENIDETDTYGRTLIDQIFMGTEVTIDAVMTEWLAQVLRQLQPWQATAFAVSGAANNFSLGTIGKLASDMDSALVFTATAGTPAAASPATLTVTQAIIHEGVDMDVLLGPGHRKIPLKWRALPYSSTGIHFFSCT